MTAIQIEAAVGKRLGPGKEEQSAMACTRTYSADDISVVISVQHLAKPLNVGAEILSLKAAFPGSKISEVAGIAEHIFVLDIPGAGTQLHVLPDSHSYLLVSVLGLDDGNNGFNAAWKIACALMGKA